MAQANHTGLYSCGYLPKSASKKKRTESAIYIFVSGKMSISHVLFAFVWQWVRGLLGLGESMVFLGDVAQMGSRGLPA